MPIRARFMLNDTTPLRRVRIRYDRSATNPSNIFNLTDENGFATINRDDTRGGIRVEVFAANTVVAAVSGALNAPVNRMLRVNDGDQQVVPSGQRQADNFQAIEVARDLYNRTFRFFQPFTEEFPFGDASPNPKRQIRLKLDSPSSTSFTDPHAPGPEFPMIHIKENEVNDAAGNIDFTGELRRHLASELSHALHFGTVGTQRRKAVRTGYVASLISAGILDGFDFGWSDGDPDTRLMAFIEAFDLFADHFDMGVGAGTTLAQRSTDWVTTQVPVITTATGGATGANVPGAVCLAIFADYAGSPGIGLQNAVEHYIRSGVFTFPAFRRFIVSEFGAGSTQDNALAAAAAARGL